MQQMKISDRMGSFLINPLPSILQANGYFLGMLTISLMKTVIGKRPRVTGSTTLILLENSIEVKQEYVVEYYNERYYITVNCIFLMIFRCHDIYFYYTPSACNYIWQTNRTSNEISMCLT